MYDTQRRLYMLYELLADATAERRKAPSIKRRTYICYMLLLVVYNLDKVINQLLSNLLLNNLACAIQRVDTKTIL